MSQKILGDSRFFASLLEIDRELAEERRAGGCLYCGCGLHSAHYWRKPRGGPGDLGRGMHKRFSYCCARASCRRRAAPESVRFLGRKVYFSVVIVLACVLMHGVTDRRAAQLREQLGIRRVTLKRWREWWLEAFARSGFWKAGRGRFSPPVDEGALPGSLLEQFLGDRRAQLLGLLRWLGPISAPPAQVF